MTEREVACGFDVVSEGFVAHGVGELGLLHYRPLHWKLQQELQSPPHRESVRLSEPFRAA